MERMVIAGNKTFYSLLALVLISIMLIGVYAYQSTQTPAVFGHSSNEIEINVNGQAKTLQQAITDKDFSARCDWSGLDSKNPWEGGMECSNGGLSKLYKNPESKDLWVESGECETAHAKGYRCKLTISQKGSYNLRCWGGENHGEWRGTVTGVRTNTDKSIDQATDAGENWKGAKVEYQENGGKWKLTSIGKENNHNSPYWTKRTCEAGGYK